MYLCIVKITIKIRNFRNPNIKQVACFDKWNSKKS